MDTTDKNIKEAFSTYTKSFDIDLEESIMDQISEKKIYSPELLRSKKRVKIGVTLSSLLFIGYFLLTFLDTLPRITNQLAEDDVYLPAIFAATLIIIMYFLMSYSQTSSRNKLII